MCPAFEHPIVNAAHAVRRALAHIDSDVSGPRLAAMDEALQRLDRISPRHRKVAECRFYAASTYEELATVLDAPTQRAWRDWRIARAWLVRELSRIA